MTYATASQFVQQFGLIEAAQLLADEQHLLTPELLSEAIKGEFSPERTPEEKDAAAAALARMEKVLGDASRLMDGYFRGAVSLPLTQMQLDEAPVSACCLELTRCGLMDDDGNLTETAEKRCKSWRDWLRDIATGKVKLVQEQQAGSGGVINGRMPSNYAWGRFNRFTGRRRPR